MVFSQNGRISPVKIFLTAIGAIFFIALPAIAEERNRGAFVHVAYFVPSDEDSVPEVSERLTRVMTNVQTFYRSEMERAGFGPLTFALDWKRPDQIRVHYVHGEKKRSDYSRGDYDLIRREVAEALFNEGNDSPSFDDAKSRLILNQEFVVIFQRLLTWKDGQVVTSGPFVGAGNHRFGVAFVYDDENLDPALLTSDEPVGNDEEGDVANNPSLTLGEFNSRYLGGLAHELGHSFGLIHNAETDADRLTRGVSLMGIGNNVYGRELRNGGEGAFLTDADTLRLSRSRALAGDLPLAHLRPKWRFLSLSAAYQPKKGATEHVPADIELVVKGRIESNVPLVGVMAYNDDATVNGDYDAKSYVTRPNADGSFSLEITDLTVTEYQLRIVGLCENGATISSEVTYRVDSDLNPSGLFRFNSFAVETLIRRLFECWNVKRMEEVIEELERRSASVDPDLVRKARHLHRLMTNPIRPTAPEAISPETKSLDLSEAKWVAARNGLNLTLRDIVPEEVFMTVGGRFFESGLFAPAPSVHRFQLGGEWSDLVTGYGIVDSHCGSARFRILGDGRELFASPVIFDNQVREATISLTGVKTLDLVVEPTEDGASRDWGVWLHPTLTR